MEMRVCVAGVSGWTGSAVTRAILSSKVFELTGAIARRHAGRDAAEILGLLANGVLIAPSLKEAQAHPADVLVDLTSSDSVKHRTKKTHSLLPQGVTQVSLEADGSITSVTTLENDGDGGIQPSSMEVVHDPTTCHLVASRWPDSRWDGSFRRCKAGSENG